MSDLRDSLDQAIREAAEWLAFADAIPKAEPSGERPATWFGVELHEPRAGSLVFRISPDDARALSRSAWGALAEETDDQVNAFLCELANVVAGRFLALRHPGAEIRIGFPTVGSRPAGPLPLVGYDLDGIELAIGWAP